MQRRRDLKHGLSADGLSIRHPIGGSKDRFGFTAGGPRGGGACEHRAPRVSQVTAKSFSSPPPCLAQQTRALQADGRVFRARDRGPPPHLPPQPPRRWRARPGPLLRRREGGEGATVRGGFHGSWHAINREMAQVQIATPRQQMCSFPVGMGGAFGMCIWNVGLRLTALGSQRGPCAPRPSGGVRSVSSPPRAPARKRDGGSERRVCPAHAAHDDGARGAVTLSSRLITAPLSETPRRQTSFPAPLQM